MNNRVTNRLSSSLDGIQSSPRTAQRASSFALAIGLVILTSLVLWSLRDRLTMANSALVYMLVILVAAAWLGTWPAILAAVLSFFGFNFLLLQPYYTLAVNDVRGLLDLLMFLTAGLIVGRLAGYARQQADTSRQVLAEQLVLYRLTSTLNQLSDPAAILSELRRVGLEEIGADHIAILPHDERQPGTSEPVLYILLNVGDSILGTVRATFPAQPKPAQQRLLRACVVQAAIAMQRVELAAQAQRSVALSEADALKTALLRAVSHDLRTPITIIKTSATNLLAFGSQLPAPQQHELAQTIEDEADRLNKLVGNLLDMSRLQAGALVLNMEWNSLEEIAGDVAAQTYKNLGTERLALSFAADLPLLRCDYGLIVQAVSNLVENSLRYEPEGGRIVLSGSAVPGAQELAVINHGASIRKEDKAMVMEPFFQAADGRPVPGHVGLGLAIARGIVEAHHGQLTILDTPGGGTTFVVRLPSEEPDP